MASPIRIRVTENSRQTSPEAGAQAWQGVDGLSPDLADIVGTTGSTKAVFRVAGRAQPFFLMLPFVALRKEQCISVFCDAMRHFPVHNQPACRTPPG